MDDEARDSKFANVLAFLFCCFFYWQIIFEKSEWIFLDYLNLAYHEAGHLLFHFGGEVLYFFGGTLGQLLAPLVIAVAFFFRGQTFAATLMLFWMSENCVNIARYCADAVAMELPLVGGDTHDWNWLLSHYGKLLECDLYADRLRVLGFSAMTLCLGVSFVLLVMSWFRKEED